MLAIGRACLAATGGPPRVAVAAAVRGINGIKGISEMKSVNGIKGTNGINCINGSAWEGIKRQGQQDQRDITED